MFDSDQRSAKAFETKQTVTETMRPYPKIINLTCQGNALLDSKQNNPTEEDDEFYYPFVSPTKCAKINGHTIHPLCDTGSQCTLITSELINIIIGRNYADKVPTTETLKAANCEHIDV